MKRLMVALLLAVPVLGLTACTQDEKEAAVQPVVQEVVESLLGPLVDTESDAENQ